MKMWAVYITCRFADIDCAHAYQLWSLLSIESEWNWSIIPWKNNSLVLIQTNTRDLALLMILLDIHKISSIRFHETQVVFLSEILDIDAT